MAKKLQNCFDASIFESKIENKKLNLNNKFERYNLRVSLLEAHTIPEQWQGPKCWICNNWTPKDIKAYIKFSNETLKAHKLGNYTRNEIINFIDNHLYGNLKTTLLITVGKIFKIRPDEWLTIINSTLDSYKTDTEGVLFRPSDLKQINVLSKKVGIPEISVNDPRVAQIIMLNIKNYSWVEEGCKTKEEFSKKILKSFGITTSI